MRGAYPSLRRKPESRSHILHAPEENLTKVSYGFRLSPE